MKYFTNLIEQSLSRTREATLSVLGINDENLRRHLGTQMNSELGSDGCFLAPPVFEHTFGWQEAEEMTLTDLRGNLLSASLLDTSNVRVPEPAVPTSCNDLFLFYRKDPFPPESLFLFRIASL